MTKTQAINLALLHGSRGIDARAVGIRYEGTGYSFVTWSVELPKQSKIKGVA